MKWLHVDNKKQDVIKDLSMMNKTDNERTGLVFFVR